MFLENCYIISGFYYDFKKRKKNNRVNKILFKLDNSFKNTFEKFKKIKQNNYPLKDW